MTAGISNEDRRAIYRRDGFRCALCDSTDGLQLHHYVPRAEGGVDHPMNLITLCWRCHAAAHGGFYDCINPADLTATTIQGMHEEVKERVKQACEEYLGDWYAENTQEVWYPYDG